MLNLLSLTAGVSSGGDATGINSNQLSINGSRTLNSEFTVNGVSVVSGSTGGVQTLPPADAIREFKVLTSAYSAEYGRTSGGTVTIVLNSGTSQYHGGVYEYFRNEDLNANNFFNNVRGQQRPVDRYNLFGAKLGGPVWIPRVYNGKDKTFFFFNYEGLRQISPYANTSSVPSAAFRTGDFSASPILIYQPGTNTPFPGNRIPSNMIDPAAAKIMGVTPSPDSSGTADPANGRIVNNLVSSGSSKPGSNTYSSRIDENLTTKDRMFGSLTHYSSVAPLQPVIPGPLESAVGPSTTTGFQAILGYTRVWSPTVVSEFRMGYFRNNSEYTPPSLGLNVQDTYGIARSVGPASPVFNISGWSQLGLNNNTLRSQIDNNYQPSFSTSKVLGNHLLKFGYDLRKNEFNIYNPGGTGNAGAFTGTYSFTGEITSGTHNSGNGINALADFLLGDIKTSAYALPQPPAGRRNSNTGVYAQDDWKITRRLTVNLGLRWEYESPMTSSNNIYSRVDPTTGTVLFAGINASDSLNLSASKTNFAPRVGFAYSLDPKTVIRSGFGIFYSQFFSDLGAQVLFPGYTVSKSYASLGTGIAQPFSLSQGMPLTLVQDLAHPQNTLTQYSPSNALSASASFAEVSPMPYGMEWNFGVQRQLPRNIILDVNYAASNGVHLPINLPYNTVPFGQATALAQANTSVTTQNARPYPSIGGFSAIAMAGHSNYQALQVNARRQVGEHLAFVVTYSRAKSLDDSDGMFTFSQPQAVNVGQFPQLYRFLDRGLSEFDRPNSLTGSVQYRVGGPRWLRGIEIDAIFTSRDGLPLTINQNNLNPAASQLRPNLIATNSIYEPQRTPNGTGVQDLLPASAANFPLGPVGPLFTGTGSSRTLVLPAGIGNLSRSTVRAPGDIDLDLGVARRFQIKERANFQVRAEAFNLLNHTNLLSPDTGLTVTANAAGQPYWNSPTFGLITGARSARFLQLSARFEF
ncbi:MAG: TonB-dependent receptor [Ignavibacteriota bacterium]